LRLKGQVVIVHRQAPSAALQRGERVAYSFEGFAEHELVVRSGFGLGPVLALPGDRVLFTKSTIEINGIAQPRFALMPESGERIIPEKHWFVWPEFAIDAQGHLAGGAISDRIVGSGVIAEHQFLGKPCHR
jgi:hypothetical protein